MTARERREINTSVMANIVTDCALFEAEKRIKELEDELAKLSVPEGWKLVPVDATRAMIDAAAKVEEDGYDAMHKAMLSAAPTPPSDEVKPNE